MGLSVNGDPSAQISGTIKFDVKMLLGRLVNVLPPSFVFLEIPFIPFLPMQFIFL